MGLDLVTVPPSLLDLDQVSRLREIGHDAEGSALTNDQNRCDLSHPHRRITCDAQQHSPVVRQEIPAHNAQTLAVAPELRTIVACIGFRIYFGSIAPDGNASDEGADSRHSASWPQ